MRQVHRQALSARAQAYLERKARDTEATDIDRAWKSARQTMKFKEILEKLWAMSGPRQRCMYCVDSHGSDIDHFWPKASYPDKAFVWLNMLLCCTECGRFKGDQFPMSDAGEPMLVDPSAENPWTHLDFDPDTGNLTARYDLNAAMPSPKGDRTVQVFNLDRREGMAEGYRRTYQRLVVCVERALNQNVIVPHQLASALQQADEHGLMGWCFGEVGAGMEPFKTLRSAAPAAWDACVTVAQDYPSLGRASGVYTSSITIDV